MAEYPKQYLTASSFTPAVFQPQVFTPKQEDISLLANSLNKLEEREEKLGAQKLAIAEAFSNARDLLPDNDETNRYITENQERITSTIDAMVNLGDMSGALDASKNLAAKFVSSPEFKARTKTHKQRNEWIGELKNSGANQDVIELYQHRYQDIPTFTYNDRGEKTGAEEWKAPLPSKAVNPFEVVIDAAKAVSVKVTDISSGTSKSHSRNRTEIVTPEAISDEAISMIMNNSDWYNSIDDQLNAGLYKISRLKESIKKLDPIKDAEEIEKINNNINALNSQYTLNGAEFSSTKSYIEHMFSKDSTMVKNAAVNNVTKSNTVSDGGGSGSLTTQQPKVVPRASGATQLQYGSGYNTQPSNTGSSNNSTGFSVSVGGLNINAGNTVGDKFGLQPANSNNTPKRR